MWKRSAVNLKLLGYVHTSSLAFRLNIDNVPNTGKYFALNEKSRLTMGFESQKHKFSIILLHGHKGMFLGYPIALHTQGLYKEELPRIAVSTLPYINRVTNWVYIYPASHYVNSVHITSAATATAAPPIAPQLAAAVIKGIAAKPELVLGVGRLVPVPVGATPLDGAGVAEGPCSFSRPAVIVTFKGVIKPAVGIWVVSEDTVDQPLPVWEIWWIMVQSADESWILHSKW